MGTKYTTKTRRNIVIWVETLSTSLAGIHEFKIWRQLIIIIIIIIIYLTANGPSPGGSGYNVRK
jgi:hypothetical protein